MISLCRNLKPPSFLHTIGWSRVACSPEFPLFQLGAYVLRFSQPGAAELPQCRFLAAKLPPSQSAGAFELSLSQRETADPPNSWPAAAEFHPSRVADFHPSYPGATVYFCPSLEAPNFLCPYLEQPIFLVTAWSQQVSSVKA